MTTDDRFDSKWTPEPNSGCFLWTSGLNVDGYGVFSDNGRRQVRSHRFAWERKNGPVPSGMMVCHTCDVRSCVNPDHLFVGTAKDNAQDASSKGRTMSGDRSWFRRHPEHIKRGDDHWTRRSPMRVARGDQHGSKTNPASVARGERQGNSRLRTADVEEIRLLSKRGISQQDIANKFGISQSAVSLIVLRKSWRHV